MRIPTVFPPVSPSRLEPSDQYEYLPDISSSLIAPTASSRRTPTSPFYLFPVIEVGGLGCMRVECQLAVVRVAALLRRAGDCWLESAIADQVKQSCAKMEASLCPAVFIVMGLLRLTAGLWHLHILEFENCPRKEACK